MTVLLCFQQVFQAFRVSTRSSVLVKVINVFILGISFSESNLHESVNLILADKSDDEILQFDHANDRNRWVLSYGAVLFFFRDILHLNSWE